MMNYYDINFFRIFNPFTQLKKWCGLITIGLITVCSQSIVAQKIGVKTGDPQTVLDVNGSVAFREGGVLSVGNGNNNNVALDSMSFYRITAPTNNYKISGFTNGMNGRILVIVNATNYTCTLRHQQSSSSANQIRTGTGGDVELLSGGTASLMYNATLQKWLVVSTQGSNSQNIQTFIRKTATETVSNSSTLQDDNDFFFTLGTNEIWLLDGIFFVNGQPSGIKLAFNTGTGSIQSDIIVNKSTGLSNGYHAIYNTSGSSLEYDLDNDDTNTIHVNGFIVGPSSGSTTFKVQWAQKDGKPETLSMLRNSFLHVQRVQ